MTVEAKDYVTVELTSAEVAFCRSVVMARQEANQGRFHSRNYRAGAAAGAIDTSADGAFQHEAQSVAVELATAKWLGSRKVAGSNVWHAASETYDRADHKKLSATPWSTDVWVIGVDGDRGRFVGQDWITTPFRERPVTALLEVKKVNVKRDGSMNLLNGDALQHGGAIHKKDIGVGAVSVVGQASDDLRTVTLAGWFPLDQQTYDAAATAWYDRFEKQGKQVRAEQVQPMRWLPAVTMPARFSAADVQEVMNSVVASLHQTAA